MFGDVLRKNICKLTNASEKKNADYTFWKILRDIAVEDIRNSYPQEVDSDTAIAVYYDILKKNESKLPKYYVKILKSNKQERYRVLNRNMWSSNAFHPDGLANQAGIDARFEMNELRRGNRIVYSWRD